MAFQFGKKPEWIDINIHTSEQLSLVIVPTIFTVLAGLTTIGRFHSRRINKSFLGVDDWFCLLAMVLAIATLICDWIMVYNGSGLPVVKVGRKQFLLWIKLQVATYLVWMVSVAALQISILAFYTRTFGIYRTFRFICFGMIAVVTAWFIGAFFSFLFACNPIHKLWDTLTPGTCTLGVPLCASVGMIHIVLDASILLMPLPQLWKLQMAVSTKIVLTFLLTLGLFATVCAIIRLECVVKILPDSLGNPTYSLWQAILFQFTEVPVGIIAICVPTLRPVARAFSQSKYGQKFSSLFSKSTSRLSGRSKGSSANDSKPPTANAEKNHSLDEDERKLNASVEMETRSARSGQSAGKPSYDDLPDFPNINEIEHR